MVALDSIDTTMPWRSDQPKQQRGKGSRGALDGVALSCGCTVLVAAILSDAGCGQGLAWATQRVSFEQEWRGRAMSMG